MRTDSPTTRPVRLTTDAKERYKGAHWGIESSAEYEWTDVPADVKLTEMGKMVEVTFAIDDVEDGTEPDEVGVLDGFASKRAAEPDILCFSPRVDERLYLALSSTSKRRFRELWIRRHPTYWLQDIAEQVGGRQARFPAMQIKVQAVGRCCTIAYHTDKRTDGPSTYEHEQGEWGGVRPMLCLSADGGLWLAGGSYTVPDEGITR